MQTALEYSRQALILPKKESRVELAIGDANQAIPFPRVTELVRDTLQRMHLHGWSIGVVPDYSRPDSQVVHCAKGAKEALGKDLPCFLIAAGTHREMEDSEIKRDYPGIPPHLFIQHLHDKDTEHIGDVPADFINAATGLEYNKPWPIELNKLFLNSTYKNIISFGQVVPHEVFGVANAGKNIFIGCGGPNSIQHSHFISALYGMERLMGVAESPPRHIIEHAEYLLKDRLNIIYVLTVVGQAREDEKAFASKNGLVVRGLYIGTGPECFRLAADLSMQVNFTKLDKQIKKAVVYLPEKNTSTWTGNKAIYRLRCAMADGGELIILAPSVFEFGENDLQDARIRKFGYRTTPEILEFVKNDKFLRDDLSVAAHLIHGSPEGRFTVRYCTDFRSDRKKNLTKEDIESVGFAWGDYKEYASKYNIGNLKHNFFNQVDGEEIFYCMDPSLGLWRV